jgi:diadenosine tetraphosphate (Ap4A) HIT family hydrolase
MPETPVFQPQPAARAGCELCAGAGGRLLWTADAWRIVRVDDADFPAFYRVISNHHVVEFSDLLAPERRRCMELVCAVERVLIETLRPTKVNLAALGNAVPHLHWHVVARFDWDSRFPQPIWVPPRRELPVPAATRLACPLERVDEAVVAALQGA